MDRVKSRVRGVLDYVPTPEVTQDLEYALKITGIQE
jgi:hypothetical protein